MKVLIVAHSFAPQTNPRALRWTKIARHWASHGHWVEVVTGAPEADEDSAHLRVHSVAAGAFEKARQNVGARSQSIDGQGKPALMIARRIYNSTYKSLYWPDYAFRFIPGALKKCREILREGGFNALITVSYPFSDHWIGRTLKRENQDLPWIVDIGDPYSFSSNAAVNNLRLFGERNRRAEAEVLRNCDTVSLTCVGAQVEYERRFPGSAEKSTVIPPVVDFGPVLHAGSSSAEQVTLVYLGTLYRQIRNPEPLLKALRSLPANVELHVYGKANDCADLFEGYQDLVEAGRIRLLGEVSHQEALAAIAKASILVNIGNSVPFQLPSKIVEYGMTGKPILNLTTIENDSSQQVLGSYRAAKSVLLPPKASEELFLRQLLEFIDEPPTPLTREEVERWIKPYTIERVAAQYERLCRGDKS